MTYKLLPLAAAVLLSACGFHLKGTQPYDRLPYAKWHLSGGTLQLPLETALRHADGQPVAAGDAQASLTVLAVFEQKDVLTITRAAAINEYLLVFQVRAQAYRNGRPWGEPIDVKVSRPMDYADSEILGKQEEEKRMWQEIRQDAAEQIVRRLSFLPPADNSEPAAGDAR